MKGAGRADPRAYGAAAAVLALALDQGSKLWLLRGFDLPARSPVRLAPGVDLVMAWNRGVSYSLLTADGDVGRWLLAATALAASAALAVWLGRCRGALSAVAVGLLLGGAVGNLVDRAAYGAVVDFVSLHALGHRWYVFNVADCAITAGVALLLVEWTSAPGAGAAKTPRSSRHS